MPPTPTANAQVLDMFNLAIADGFLAPEELAVIYSKGGELGLERQHIDEIIKNPDSVSLADPESLVEAIMRLYDLGVVLLSDGVIDPREVSLLRSFARRFLIRDDLIDGVVNAVIEEVRGGTSRDDLVTKLKEEIGS
jgi:hypothetical protein